MSFLPSFVGFLVNLHCHVLVLENHENKSAENAHTKQKNELFRSGEALFHIIDCGTTFSWTKLGISQFGYMLDAVLLIHPRKSTGTARRMPTNVGFLLHSTPINTLFCSLGSVQKELVIKSAIATALYIHSSSVTDA